VPSDDVPAFVHAALPDAPARVLEVGAGDGELAAELSASGYDLVPIDPEPRSPAVRAVALHELDEPERSFDAAVAVVSLHHVEPLERSCRRLADVLKPGGVLVVDEFDVDSFDARAGAWWREHRLTAHEHDHESPEELVADLRRHLHSLTTLLDALGQWFRFEPVQRLPYLYRWDLPDGFRSLEARMVADGELPATGARVVGVRRARG
jgi:SAM-dependent methyltransferase